MSPRGRERNARGACLCPRPGAGARPLERQGDWPRTGPRQPSAGALVRVDVLVRVDNDASRDRSASSRQAADRRRAGGPRRSSAVRLTHGAAPSSPTTSGRGAQEACAGQAAASSSSCKQAPREVDAGRRQPHRHIRGRVPGRQASRRRARALRSPPRRDDLPVSVGPVPRRYTSAGLAAREENRKGGRRLATRPFEPLTSVRRRRSGKRSATRSRSSRGTGRAPSGRASWRDWSTSACSCRSSTRQRS